MIEILAPSPESFPETYMLPASLLHDLRTPLNQIIGYAELLLELARDEGQTTLLPDISKVRSAGGDLLSLINDKFSTSTSRLPPKPNETDWLVTANSSGSEKVSPGGMLVDLAQGTVLVVDDSESNRDLLARRLQGQGYTVMTAENGRIAIEMALETNFDLVLLDIMMPEMDGFEVLKRLKSDELLKHIPVIMISAVSETDSALRCIEMGAEDYLPKPFDPTLLKVRTMACMERKHGHDKEIWFTQELQQSYRRAQELERMRDDLTNMIVHDLRSPLISIISSLKSMENDGDLSDKQRERMDVSLSGGGTLLGMINDLLDINKIESGSLQLDLTEIDVADLIGRACKQSEPLAASKIVELSVDVEHGLRPLLADRHRLLRTLVNLISNAIRFTSRGSVVKIIVGKGRDGRSLHCSVSDSGDGIPAKEFGRIFEKFGQIETCTSGTTHSTGLGLTLCKLVVEAHGGRIWVESKAGSGSTFSFTIPIENMV